MPAVPPVRSPAWRYMPMPSATNSAAVTSACASSNGVCRTGSRSDANMSRRSIEASELRRRAALARLSQFAEDRPDFLRVGRPRGDGHETVDFDLRQGVDAALEKRELVDLLGNLHGEFARRAKNEHLDGAQFGVGLLDGGNAERGGLA